MEKIIFVPLTEEPPVTASTQPARGRDWYKQLTWRVDLEVPVSLIKHRYTFTAVYKTRTIDGKTDREAIAINHKGEHVWFVWGYGRNAQEAIEDLADRLNSFDLSTWARQQAKVTK
jgi:hypothetical protein